MSTTDDDLIVFRRRSAHAGQWVSCDRPRVKLEVERGTFVIFKRVAELLGVGKGDAVMFAFNRREGCAYIYLEEPEEDSYFLTCPKGSYFRFTSKALMRFFVESFDIKEEKVVYFDVERVANTCSNDLRINVMHVENGRGFSDHVATIGADIV